MLLFTSQANLPTIHVNLSLCIKKRSRKNVLPMISDYVSYDASNTIHWCQLQDQIINIKIKINFSNIWQFIMGFCSVFKWMSLLRRVGIPNTKPSNIIPVGVAKGPMYAKTTLPIIWEWCPFSLALSFWYKK